MDFEEMRGAYLRATQDDIVTRTEQEIDFVEYLRLWSSPDVNDQAVRALHKAADEIENLRKVVTLQYQDIIELRSEIQRMNTIVSY